MKTEYFIRATSFAAPFFSDESSGYVTADSPVSALDEFAGKYTHPCGLYAAMAYASADAFHKGVAPLAKWLCNHEREVERLTANLGAYSQLGHGPGDFDINGERHRVENPKAGRAVLV